jgi:hypothetical protein
MKKTALILFTFLTASLFAQNTNKKAYFSHDIGVFLGGAYYIGDLNSTHFFMTQPGIGVFYRFNYNYRLSFRGGFNFGSVQADDSQTNNPDQLERNLNFKSKIQEFYTQAEFNFWEYRVGHSDFIFAPYIFAGVGVFHFDPMGHYQNQWVELRDLATEGQKTSQNPTQKKYSLYQPVIPFGLGFKLSVSKMITIGFEWGPRKTFTDYLDDVSGKYVDPVKLAAEKGAMAAIMSNRAKNPSDFINDVGKLRGNPNTKDWYFFYGFVISFKLKGKPKECKGAF